MKTWSAILVLFLLSNAVLAQNEDTTRSDSDTLSNPQLIESLSSDRPGASLTPLTLQKGLWQIQFGLNGGESYDLGSKKDYNTGGMPFDLRTGIAKNLELMISAFPEFGSNVGAASGIEYASVSLGASLRYNIVRNSNAGSLAVFAGYNHVNYENIEWGSATSVKAIYAIPLGNILAFTTNLGYSFYSFDADGFDYTFNLGISILPRLGAFIETYGSIPSANTENAVSENWIDGGLFFMVNDNFQLDILYAQGTFNDFQNFFTSLGLTYRFGTLK